eukprot:640941-Pyramimonas_sp.AAC.1
MRSCDRQSGLRPPHLSSIVLGLAHIYAHKRFQICVRARDSNHSDLVAFVRKALIGETSGIFSFVTLRLVRTLQIISEILEACKLALMQQLLGNKKLSSLHGTYYLCPATFLWLTVGVCFTELHRFIGNKGLDLMVRAQDLIGCRPY